MNTVDTAGTVDGSLTMNKKPSEFELQILGLLWEHAPLTVREVLDRLADGKKRAYTSVLSVMQVMEKKGLLTRTRGDGLADQWSPGVARESVATPLMERVVSHLFANSPSALMQHLLDSKSVDAAELASIRRMIEEAEREGGKDAQ